VIEVTIEGNLTPFAKWSWPAFATRLANATKGPILAELKVQAPVKTGRLRDRLDEATHIGAADMTMIFADSVEYFPWVVFDGTAPHNIPGAFGRPLPFGTSGQFNGMFHPGITNPDDFPRRVWATMEAAFMAAAVKTLEQEFV